MSRPVKRIAILGSTGSIGVNTLNVIRALKNEFEVIGLSANDNVGLLAKQSKAFKPSIVAVKDATSAVAIKNAALSKKTKIVFGEEGLIEIVSRRDVDLIMLAISGIACLRPLLRAIDTKKKIALANKEALVAAGEIVMRRAKRMRATIIPVDSEHSAIFQCLDGKDRNYLKKVYLTSSGGPLRTIRSPLS